MADTNWARLATAVVDRRAELGITQVQLAQRGELSLDRVQSLEAARRTSYRKGTLAALERGLGWEPGSVERILAGGEAVRVPGAQASVELTGDMLLQALNQLPADHLRDLIAISLREREAEADAPWAEPDDPHLRRLLELWPQTQEWQRAMVVGVLEQALAQAPPPPTGNPASEGENRMAG